MTNRVGQRPTLLAVTRRPSLLTGMTLRVLGQTLEAPLQKAHGLFVHPHAAPEPIILMALLAALIGKSIALPAAEVDPTWWTVELAHTPTTQQAIEHMGAGKPPTHPAEVGLGGL